MQSPCQWPAPGLQVDIEGVDGELLQVVQKSLGLKPNFAYTTKDVELEVGRVFQTGFFEMVEPVATDTRDGIALVLKVIILALCEGLNICKMPS